MSNMRQELAIMLIEKNGQELLDALVKYCEDQYNDGYDDAQQEMNFMLPEVDDL